MASKSPYSEGCKNSLLEMEGIQMKHMLSIKVSKKPAADGIVSYRRVSIREKLLSRLFGKKQKLIIILPGNTVESLCINEVPEGDDAGG